MSIEEFVGKLDDIKKLSLETADRAFTIGYDKGKADTERKYSNVRSKEDILNPIVRIVREYNMGIDEFQGRDADYIIDKIREYIDGQLLLSDRKGRS